MYIIILYWNPNSMTFPLPYLTFHNTPYKTYRGFGKVRKYISPATKFHIRNNGHKKFYL